MQKIPGPSSLDTNSLKFAVVQSLFNSEITDKLLEGCLQKLREYSVPEENLLHVEVPGAFELPAVCRRLAKSEKYDAIIALGAVIRGDTYHYELVCHAAADGILAASLKSSVPVIFGVITTDNDEQALARAGGKEGNKGADAVDAAIHMIRVHRDLDHVE